MAETPTGTSTSVNNIPDWLRDYYMKMLTSATGYIFKPPPTAEELAGRKAVADANKKNYADQKAAGTLYNSIPRDKNSGLPLWMAFMGMNQNDVAANQPTAEEMKNRLTYGVAPDESTIPRLKPTPGYVSPWQQGANPTNPFSYPFVPSQWGQGEQGGSGINYNPTPPQAINTYPTNPNPYPGRQTNPNPFPVTPVVTPPTGQSQPPPGGGGGTVPGTPSPTIGTDPAMWMEGIMGKNSYDGTEYALNPMHFSTDKGTQFALDQIKRLSGNVPNVEKVGPTNGPYSWPGQDTLFPGEPEARALDGTPLGGMNAGAVANLYKVYDAQTADIRLAEELARQGITVDPSLMSGPSTQPQQQQQQQATVRPEQTPEVLAAQRLLASGQGSAEELEAARKAYYDWFDSRGAGGGIVSRMEVGGPVDPNDPNGAPDPTGTGGTSTTTPVNTQGAVYGDLVGGYEPYLGQRFAEPGDLTNRYLAGATRITEGIVDPYRTIIDPTDTANFALNRMQDLFTDPNMAIHNQIRNFDEMPQLQNSYQANQYQPAQYNPQDLMGPGAQALASYGGGNYMNINAPQVYQPNDVQSWSWSSPAAQQTYMNPFNQAVTQQQRQDAIQAFNENASGLDADAVKSGAFGGYRHGLAEGVSRRELDRQLNDISATGLRDAYTTGLGAFQSDRDSNLQAGLANQRMGLDAQSLYGQLENQAMMANQNAFGNTQDRALQALLASANMGSTAGLNAAQLSESSRQFGANLTDRGQQQQQQFNLDTARTGQDIQNQIIQSNLAAMGLRGATSMDILNGTTAYQNQLQNQLGILQNAGSQMDQYQQGLMDYDYNNFLQQRDYPLQQLGYMSNLLNGVPAPTWNSSSQTVATNPWTQAAGLGIAGLGALGSYFGSRTSAIPSGTKMV
jgi:hypothetical protein